jgi:hypothetical protein
MVVMLPQPSLVKVAFTYVISTYYIGLEVDRVKFQGKELNLVGSMRYFKQGLMSEWTSWNPDPPEGLGVNGRMLNWDDLPDEVCCVCMCLALCLLL